MYARIMTLVLLLVAAAAHAPLAAQGQAPESEWPDEREAARLLRDARAEQARFERIRRQNLPWTQSRGGGCDPRFGDEIIGRFCLMHGGDDGRDYEPPEESEAVTEARERLLALLASAAARVPWDGWLTGQRVRYLVESGEVDAAVEAARTCQAAEWWCAALAGYTHHYAGQPARADSAYSLALELIPESVRPQWTDLSKVLEGRTLSQYRRLRGEERVAFETRFWELSRLLFMRPGNDARSEHFSRNVLDIFQDRAQSADGIAWGDDLREILLRYGWPRGWARVQDTRVFSAGGPPSLVSYYSNTRKQLLAPHETLFPGERPLEGEWDVAARRARTAYNVPVPLAPARWLRRLDHQVAVFRRPDGARLLAAYEVHADSMLNPDSVAVAPAAIVAALALVGAGAAEARVTPFPAGGHRDAVLLSVEPGVALVSVEVLSEEARRAARARGGREIPALEPGRLALSDLLLLRTGDPLPDSLEEAVSLARGSDRLHPGERLGVYWEVYGLPPEEVQALSVSLRLVDRRGGWLRRTGERLGLVRELAPVRLRWQEQASAGDHVPRALAIQIPEVPEGDYVLELTVSRAGEEPVVARRAVEVAWE
jgi:hypothetical protein